MKPTARVTWEHSFNDTANVLLVGSDGREHDLEVGSAMSSGYCYTHQTFDCAENLNQNEQLALNEAT